MTDFRVGDWVRHKESCNHENCPVNVGTQIKRIGSWGESPYAVSQGFNAGFGLLERYVQAYPAASNFKVGDWARHKQPCPTAYGGRCTWTEPRQITNIRDDWADTADGPDGRVDSLEHCDPPKDCSVESPAKKKSEELAERAEKSLGNGTLKTFEATLELARYYREMGQ